MELFRRTVARGQHAFALALGLCMLASLGISSASAQATPERYASAQYSATVDTVIVSANPLTTGCNQVTETGLPVGGSISTWVTANVQPSSSVISVWHYDNASQHYQAAYFNVPAVPVDVMTFPQAVDAYFICVSASASAP